ncbi:endonuclease III domain-containing protein [Candidatus Woesearchaeota archaeon]|nr:endonuclease III domain-containing protein [Candidatus Woesearchaeota archaeon]
MNSIRKIYNILIKEFKEQGWWPISSLKNKEGIDENGYHHKSYYYPETDEQIFEICVGAILTQNTSWKNVEKAITNLKQNNSLSVNSILELNQNKLAELIKSSGYHNQKARKLKEFAKFYIKNKNNIHREELLRVWGIGPETADSILLYAFRKEYFVIDTYTKRIFLRIGLCSQKISYNEFQSLIQNSIKKDYKIYNEYHALLVKLGKETCKTKPLCFKCLLKSTCSFSKNSKLLLKNSKNRKV